MAGNIKQYFHNWCDRKQLQPNFNVRTAGRKDAPRFICELRVEGFSYTGIGNSTTKKEAQYNAVRDFLQYLIMEKVIDEKEVSFSEAPTAKDSNGVSVAKANICMDQLKRPVFQPGESPNTIGEAYRPVRREDGSDMTYIDILANQQKVEEAESVDMNANIHGNWTLDNCKQRLNQFMQTNRIDASYKYTLIGSAPSVSFVCELSFFVKQLKRTISARESGSNKQSASKSCALSLVRQLFHLGVIEAFGGVSKKNKTDAALMTPYEVSIDPQLEQDINDLLDELGIVPNDIKIDKITDADEEQQPISLVTNKVLEEFVTSKPQIAGVVSWSPARMNWNAWTGCNIDEGPLADSTLNDVSFALANNFRERFETDMNFQKTTQDRFDLPIASKKSQIIDEVKANNVIIIRGNTGCGKTTQVCQYILDDFIEAERGAYCNVIVTQPRRISAISVAERIASERCESLGESVGYSVRFDSVLPRPYGGILFCTVGVLLRKLEGGLRGVSHVIVDEIHERDVNTDVILIVLRDMIHTYPDLKVILMSATVDTRLFSKYFNNCPVLEVEGSCFPVTEYFLEDVVQLLDFKPPEDVGGGKRKFKNTNAADTDEVMMDSAASEENMNLVVPDSYPAIVKQRVAMLREKEVSYELVEELLLYISGLEKKGAILVFLPGWNYIFSLMRHLSRHHIFSQSNYVILPLHSQLPKGDQQKVFEAVAEGCTKIILSTNIAESSVTINDVVYVIDACKVKMKLFTAHNNMTSYVTVWASRSNVQQRKGRAGRVCPGMSFHLITRARYQKLEEHITPEIFRIPLHEVALAIKLLRLGAIGQFLSKAMEAPPIDAVIEAEVMLRDMKCLDNNDELTPLGSILAKLPIEPRLGKMMVLSAIFSVGDALATIAANSTTFPEVFIAERRLLPMQRALAGNRHSDHIAMLNAFQKWSSVRRRGEDAEFDFCENKQISRSTMLITTDAKKQLRDLLIQEGFSEEAFLENRLNFYEPDPNVDVVVALLSMGMYPNVCYHTDKRKVLTMECKAALIHKLSVNCSKFAQHFPSPFFVFGEKIRTKAVSCKQMTMVTPIDLLLFGSRTVEYVNGIIRLDGWINLKINPKSAAAIVALRPALDSLIIRASKDPQLITELTPTDNRVIQIIRELCQINAGRYGLEPVTLQQNSMRTSAMSIDDSPTDRARGDRSGFSAAAIGFSSHIRNPAPYSASSNYYSNSGNSWRGRNSSPPDREQKQSSTYRGNYYAPRRYQPYNSDNRRGTGAAPGNSSGGRYFRTPSRW